MIEARESVLNTDAQGREALIVEATLRSDCGSDDSGIHLRRFVAGLAALIIHICHIAEQEQTRPDEDVARLDERSHLAATLWTIAIVKVADAA